MVRKTALRILMIAPQPCFDPRGAPFCVLQQVKALIALGYEIDLVTYPMGRPLSLPGLQLFRAPAFPFIRSVRPGFSLAKFPLDLLVFWTALCRLCVGQYRYLHTHEEAALMGVLLAFLFRCKHLYTMHCDLSQLVGRLPLLIWLMKIAQCWMVRGADVVVTFYPELTERVRLLAPGKPVYMTLPPALDEALPLPDEDELACLRQALRLEDGPVLLYTGTLAPYQGLDLLLRSARIVTAHYPMVRYVIVGGTTQESGKLRALARQLGVAHIVRFISQRPLEEMPALMALADILVSPRCAGTHTPLKLYTYLRSGKPILATNIMSHTQVLDAHTALLVPPLPAALAQGTMLLLQNPLHAHELGLCGQQVAQRRHCWQAFLAQNRLAYAAFADGV
ncbi:MAG TPA: glycosyltransferase family 4 protein [Ktedonobacteraceae bacterium]|nr:glycosyltransferase family 4 protein [Ktedonobacteraceae bacterium]